MWRISVPRAVLQYVLAGCGARTRMLCGLFVIDRRTSTTAVFLHSCTSFTDTSVQPMQFRLTAVKSELCLSGFFLFFSLGNFVLVFFCILPTCFSPVVLVWLSAKKNRFQNGLHYGSRKDNLCFYNNFGKCRPF